MKRKNLNIIVFCGGVGTRLWPVSRQSNPKQFHPFFNRQTLVQNMVYSGLRPVFSWDRIFISSGERYFEQVTAQLPEILPENFILEPEMRDTGPAVGYALLWVMAKRPGEPIAVLWQDHLIKQTSLFKKVLQEAARIVAGGNKPLVYLGVPPRYPSVNLGYIEIGQTLVRGPKWELASFVGFREKPSLPVAKKLCQDHKHFWNPGYFVCDPEFLLQKIKQQKRKYNLWEKLELIRKVLGTSQEKSVVKKVFPQFEKVAIDYVVHEQVKPAEAVVIVADLGWHDIGEWRALKEAWQKKPKDNLVKGKYIGLESEGCFIFSSANRLVAGIGLKDMVVVDTEDVVLVCPTEQAHKVKQLVNQLKEEKLDRYL